MCAERHDAGERTLDESVTVRDVRLAVAALRRARSGSPRRALDTVVDAMTPRPVAHAAEEALRVVSGGVPLHRLSGADSSVIGAAMAWLNSRGIAIASRARTRFQGADGPG